MNLQNYWKFTCDKILHVNEPFSYIGQIEEFCLLGYNAM
jgi:hypothetical protein